MFGARSHRRAFPFSSKTQGWDEDMDEQYVVVSIAPNGVVHVWGDNESNPYVDKRTAESGLAALLKTDREQHPLATPVMFKVRKILGRPPLSRKPEGND